LFCYFQFVEHSQGVVGATKKRKEPTNICIPISVRPQLVLL
jgi:hypothetical protein